MADLPLGDEPGHDRPDEVDQLDDAAARHNALRAGRWADLVEVDARVSDALLDALEDAGVPAYAAAADPGRGLDRIYVDASRRDLAAAVVAAELPGLLRELAPEPEGEDAFDAIVAGFDREPDDEVPPWPVVEDLAPVLRANVRPAPPVVPEPEEVQDPPYDEGHFVAPPPPPIPPADPVTRWSAVLVALGVLLLVGLPLLNTWPSVELQAVAIVAIVGGIGTLVWRMRDAPPDEDPDDGAVL